MLPDNETAVRLARLLRDEQSALIDVVVGHQTVLVTWSDAAAVPDLPVTRGARLAPETARSGRRIEIPVSYDGPDLETVAGLTGLSPEEVVARHTGVEHVAAFLGFQPGFAYLARRGRAASRSAARRAADARPRRQRGHRRPVLGVYPRDSPGGWRLLGQPRPSCSTPRVKSRPCSAPGDLVWFVAA